VRSSLVKKSIFFLKKNELISARRFVVAARLLQQLIRRQGRAISDRPVVVVVMVTHGAGFLNPDTRSFFFNPDLGAQKIATGRR
jgi:hypothetical protein